VINISDHERARISCNQRHCISRLEKVGKTISDINIIIYNTIIETYTWRRFNSLKCINKAPKDFKVVINCNFNFNNIFISTFRMESLTYRTKVCKN